MESLLAHRDSQDLAEILEVYYLCLLLGYEGKFAGGAKGELLQLMANLRERIERIFASNDARDAEFSPDREFGVEPAPSVVVADPLNRHLRLFAFAAFVFAVCCYLGFSFALHSQTREIHRLVMERVGSRNAAGDQP